MLRQQVWDRMGHICDEDAITYRSSLGYAKNENVGSWERVLDDRAPACLNSQREYSRFQWLSFAEAGQPHPNPIVGTGWGS
jgi:hypothetical protein